MNRLARGRWRNAAGIAVAMALAGCGGTPQVPAPPPPEVVVAQAAQRDVAEIATFTGNLQATASVEIRARVQGVLERMDFVPTSLVRKNDLLFVIEQEPYEAARDRAQANVRSAEAVLRRAESDLDRLEEAVRTNAVSQQEVTRARAERDQANAALLSSKAALTGTEIDLSYTMIRSPLTGVISRNFVDVGNLVGRNEATLLSRVVKIDPMFVYFDVDERRVAEMLERTGGIRPQDPDSEHPPPRVLVSIDGMEATVEGRVDYVDNRVDPSTGTIEVRGVLPNPDGVLLPGFFARVRVPGKVLEDAVLVPETALSADLGGRYLLIVGAENVVEKRYVTEGQLEDDGMRVILEGISPGERFVARGLLKARPGLPVTPTTAETDAGGSGS